MVDTPPQGPYRCEVIQGDHKAVEQAINALAVEGFDLVSLHPLNVVLDLLTGPRSVPAAYCVFRRQPWSGLPIPKGGDQ